jgi:hypothetical protein
MTPYREPGTRPPPPTFEMRTEPLTLAVTILIFGFVFAVPGVLATTSGSANGFLMGGVFVLLSAGIVLLGIRGITTKVRFTLEDEHVRLEWRRFGRTLRHELLARDSLVDVGLDLSPASGEGTLQCIVVGTKNGDVPLDNTKGSHRAGYDRHVRALAEFLRIPVRPQ